MSEGNEKMTFKRTAAVILNRVRMSLAFIALMQSFLGPAVQSARADDENEKETASPIKHVIVIVGENRTFDHIYATYKPKRGETVSNLLSKGIVKEDGTKGPNFALAHQFSADITGSTETRGGRN